MLKGHATVYRCTRDRCSREREVIHRWGKWRDIKLARQRYRLLRVLSARHKELFYQRLLDVWERL
jgi:DNA-binding winged helix-turn-helix (wHTH) protein